jgi:dTDP-4-amino-4,6-dideoxygalactose transaminase
MLVADAITRMLAGGKSDGKYVSIGVDHNISELQASVLLSQYGKLEGEMYLREKNAAYLAGRLAELDFATAAEYDPRIDRHAYHLFVIRLNVEAFAEKGIRRGQFIKAINAEGIPLGSGYNPLYTFPCVTSESVERMIGGKIDVTPLPNCERASRLEGSWLGHTCLLGSRADIDVIIEAMRKVWAHADELRTL